MSTTPGDSRPAVQAEEAFPRGLPGSTRKRFAGLGDAIFRRLCQAAALFVIALVILLVAVLFAKAWQAISTIGISFFTTSKWDAVHRDFGALAFVYGTTITSVIAMLVAIPLGVGTATFLAEVAPPWLRRAGSLLVEMLAVIPSVVYGFWGLYVFAPAMEHLISALGGPEHAGISLLSAGLVLGIMIVPYAAAVSFDVIRAVPRSQREAALALGATRWQTIRTAVLPYAGSGIIGGCFLALGRALGETMAVTMLVGNRPDISLSIFGMGNSIPSIIANEFTEADYDLYLSALVELGLVLLLVSVGFSALGRILIWRMSRPGSRRLMPSRLLQGLRSATTPNQGRSSYTEQPNLKNGRPARGLSATRRAQWINRIMIGSSPEAFKYGLLALAILACLLVATAMLIKDPDVRVLFLVGLSVLAAFTVVATMGVLGLCQTVTLVPLFLILGYLAYRGASALDWDFFTQLPRPVGEKGGGMVNAFYGSALMIALATAFSVPVGLLSAIYLAEYRRSRLGPVVRFVAEMLGSVPSIVIGIFGYYAVVRGITGDFSGLAGGFALGIMMLPIVIRASEEALKLVPGTLRHASYALGASHWQTVLRVSVPAALPAIITAILLSIARVAGETAPLLLTASNNSFWPRSLFDYTPSLPMFIFKYAESPYEDWHRQAWAAAFVLVSAIMLLNFGIRFLSGKRLILASHAD